MLQAESEKLRQAWIQAVQASIASAYKDIADNYYIEVWTHTEHSNIYCCKHNLIRLLGVWPVPLFSAALGPDSLPLNKQHRLCQRAQREGGEGWQRSSGRGRRPPSEGTEPARKRTVLWLRPNGSMLGFHQPGCAALHRVLRDPQVTALNSKREFCFERMREDQQRASRCTVRKNIC